jgi:cytochrome c oxidase subunit 2
MIEMLRYFGLPVGISSVSGRIDEIIVIVHYLMLILFVGWGIFFIVSLVKFRSSKNKKANYKGVESHYSSVLEAAIAVIEIVILFGFAFPIWAERVNDVPDNRDAESIRVIAQQYAWNIHYPGPDGKFGETRIELVDEQDNPIGLDRNSEFAEDDFTTINQLHIPVNRKIRVDLSSKDVIHNFKLPELRVSQDAIPGMVIPVHFTATSTSEEFLKTAVGTKREGKGLEISCAQLCGLGHYRMKGYVTIHDDEGYQAWLDEQAEYLEEDSGDDDWGDDDW